MVEFYGYYVIFMFKFIYGFFGNGMYFYISLWKDGENVFIGEDGLSDMVLYFIGGIFKYVKVFVVFINLIVNSYKRFVLGYEVLVYISWGYRNRSVFIRVLVFKGSGVRIEYCCLDLSVNFYFVFVGIFMVGLDGIKKKVELDLYVEINVYEMDDVERERLGIDIFLGSFGEVLEELKKDKIVREVFGGVYKNFIDYKEREWEEYIEYLSLRDILIDIKKVMEWEFERYFYV